MSTPRFSVGIDLGTTNCALAWVELSPAGTDVTRSEVLEVSQVVQPGSVEARPLLPSFIYGPAAAELPLGALALPWDGARERAIGEWARSHGALVPGRLVSSAKSWLSNGAVDRRDSMLPVGGAEDLARISPVEASAQYLRHLKEAWNWRFATGEEGDPALALEEQEVTIAVPASFDAVARELTAEAAAQAGLRHLTLIEEPQAALYAWLEAMGDAWRGHLRPGDLLLVCDLGGGTTDLSLIEVSDASGELALNRIAVGEHILLGGDNMDLALGAKLEQKLAATGRKLDRWQSLALTHAARMGKERLFADPALAAFPISVPGRGSSLMASTLRTELTREELSEVLLEGFFPKVAASERPATPRRMGFTTLGLPYAQEPAVTRHIAHFLSRHGAALGRALHPTAVLFNGGVMKASLLKTRVMELLGAWAQAAGAVAPRELPGGDLDLAVAHGAAFHGLVRHGRAIRIRGGTARAYYVGIEAAMPAVPGMAPPMKTLCLAPMGMEEGSAAEPAGLELGLVLGERAHFRLFASSLRREDRVGTLFDEWELGEGELEELPPIEALLPGEGGQEEGVIVPVRLRAQVTELGTLEVHCIARDGRRWRLEFNLRAGAEERADG